MAENFAMKMLGGAHAGGTLRWLQNAGRRTILATPSEVTAAENKPERRLSNWT